MRAVSEARAEAGRLGGKRSAEARRQATGSAQPKQTRSKPEAIASKQSKQASSPGPGPIPIQPANVMPNLITPSRPSSARPHGLTSPQKNSGHPEPARSGSEPWRDRAPRSLDEATEWPLEHRAQSCLTFSHNAEWANPHRWPEVIAVHEALTGALGHAPTRLCAMRADHGVKAVVQLFADGFTLDELLQVCAAAQHDDWWRTGSPKGLSSLTPEVVRRTLAGAGGGNGSPILSESDRIKARIEARGRVEAGD